MTTPPSHAARPTRTPARARRRDVVLPPAEDEDGVDVVPSGAPDGTLEDSRTLERSLRGLVASLQRTLESVDPPLTPVQLWCLHELEANGGATVGDLAEAVGVVPSTVSRNAERLVVAGLVSRRAVHGDRRHVSLKLTPAGSRVLAEVFEARARALDSTVARMDGVDRVALLRGAHAFTVARDAHDGHAGVP